MISLIRPGVTVSINAQRSHLFPCFVSFPCTLRVPDAYVDGTSPVQEANFFSVLRA